MSKIEKIIFSHRRDGIETGCGYATFDKEKEVPELCFYGDIVDTDYGKWGLPDDQYPSKVAEFLKQVPKGANLTVRVNSGGGDVFGGIAIYNVLKNRIGKTTVYIDGLAASIASVIAMAGDEIIMMSGSQLMIHKPWAECIGNADDLLRFAGQLDKAEESILGIYGSKLKNGISRDQVKSMMAAETWMTCDEAQNIFDLAVQSGMSMAAKYSDFYKYKNRPETIEAKDFKDEQKEKLKTGLEILKILEV